MVESAADSRSQIGKDAVQSARGGDCPSAAKVMVEPCAKVRQILILRIAK
jgi:hypothetical protein